MSMMWVRHILLAFISLGFGAAVSAGTFAFLLVVGVIPRILGKMSEAKRIFLAENLVVLGVIAGALLTVFEWEAHAPWEWLTHLVFGVYGLSAGIFVGCISVALAEILNTFPIVFRRFYIKRGLSWALFAMAMGKMLGAFYYFCGGYGLPKYW